VAADPRGGWVLTERQYPRRGSGLPYRVRAVSLDAGGHALGPMQDLGLGHFGIDARPTAALAVDAAGRAVLAFTREPGSPDAPARLLDRGAGARRGLRVRRRARAGADAHDRAGERAGRARPGRRPGAGRVDGPARLGRGARRSRRALPHDAGAGRAAPGALPLQLDQPRRPRDGPLGDRRLVARGARARQRGSF
jgi:hypothetical protein